MLLNFCTLISPVMLSWACPKVAFSEQFRPCTISPGTCCHAGTCRQFSECITACSQAIFCLLSAGGVGPTSSKTQVPESLPVMVLSCGLKTGCGRPLLLTPISVALQCATLLGYHLLLLMHACQGLQMCHCSPASVGNEPGVLRIRCEICCACVVLPGCKGCMASQTDQLTIALFLSLCSKTPL